MPSSLTKKIEPIYLFAVGLTRVAKHPLSKNFSRGRLTKLSDGHNKDRRFLRSSESGDTSEYVAGIRREVRLYPCPRSSCSSKPGSFDPQFVKISL
jgi:hypothetical protein